MDDYPPGSTAKVYYDIENNPRPLFWMVRNEFDWAASRIIEGEKAIAENAKLKKLNSQLVDKSNANTIANARLDEENAKLRRVADAAALYVGEPDMNTYLYNLEDALLEAGYKI